MGVGEPKILRSIFIDNLHKNYYEFFINKKTIVKTIIEGQGFSHLEQLDKLDHGLRELINTSGAGAMEGFPIFFTHCFDPCKGDTLCIPFPEIFLKID